MGGEQSKIDTTKVAPPATHCHFSSKLLEILFTKLR